MALVAALVDRARIVQNTSTGVKVDGTTQMVETHGSWFRARLMVTAEPRKRDEQGERRKVVTTPQLMFGVRDLDGGSLINAAGQWQVNGDMRVEVASPELGSAVFRTLGDPV